MQKTSAGMIAFIAIMEFMRSFALFVVLAFVGVRLRRFGLLSEKAFNVFSYVAVGLPLIVFPLAVWFRLRSFRDLHS